MAREQMIEEFHVTVLAPQKMKKTTSMRLRRTLNSRRFHAELRRAIQEVFDRHTSLHRARFLLGR